MSLSKLEKQIQELRKENKELQTHNKFLVERLERWAERNFQLRTDLMNSPMAEKINKLNEMIKKQMKIDLKIVLPYVVILTSIAMTWGMWSERLEAVEKKLIQLLRCNKILLLLRKRLCGWNRT